MSKKKTDSAKSIRLRIEKDLLDRIDQIAGEGGRQRFIHDAIQGRLDEDLPPVVFDLIRDIDDLKARVAFLETAKSVGVQMSELNDVARNELCLDDIDRKLVSFFVRNNGGTTPELAESLLGNRSKRRTILDRIDRLNARAKKLYGKELLDYQKGLVNNKRGAWWITDVALVIL
ncbi:MAG: hypothetical protein ACW98U_07335 [Candidatus Thorarchaeota archaeon]|jgi:hypothetical protein